MPHRAVTVVIVLDLANGGDAETFIDYLRVTINGELNSREIVGKGRDQQPTYMEKILHVLLAQLGGYLWVWV